MLEHIIAFAKNNKILGFFNFEEKHKKYLRNIFSFAKLSPVEQVYEIYIKDFGAIKGSEFFIKYLEYLKKTINEDEMVIEEEEEVIRESLNFQEEPKKSLKYLKEFEDVENFEYFLNCLKNDGNSNYFEILNKYKKIVDAHLRNEKRRIKKLKESEEIVEYVVAEKFVEPEVVAKLEEFEFQEHLRRLREESEKIEESDDFEESQDDEEVKESENSQDPQNSSVPEKLENFEELSDSSESSKLLEFSEFSKPLESLNDFEDAFDLPEDYEESVRKDYEELIRKEDESQMVSEGQLEPEAQPKLMDLIKDLDPSEFPEFENGLENSQNVCYNDINQDEIKPKKSKNKENKQEQKLLESISVPVFSGHRRLRYDSEKIILPHVCMRSLEWITQGTQKEFPNLKVLSFFGNFIDDPYMLSRVKLPKLEMLSLGANKELEKLDWLYRLDAPNLKVLDLRYCGIRKVEELILVDIAFPNIEKIYAYGNPLHESMMFELSEDTCEIMKEPKRENISYYKDMELRKAA